jgi:predicted nucleotidyltransferase
MTKEFIITSLREELPYIKNKFGVQSIGLFGSYSKNTNIENSDLDFFVEVDQPIAKNYFGLLDFLEKKFNSKIDLIRKGSHLRDKFLKTVEKEIIYA